MRTPVVLTCCVLLAALIFAGCGGGGSGSATPSPPSSTASTLDAPSGGKLLVHTAATDDYRSTVIGTSAVSDYVFIGLYRAWFNRIEYQPPPGWLCTVSGPQIYTSREDGSGLHALITNAFGGISIYVYCPRWSPDGNRIAFHTSSTTIAACNADGSGRQTLLKSGDFYSLNGISWAPDGRMYFSATLGSQMDIFRLDVNLPGSVPVKITDDADEDAWPDVSPDGRFIAWSRRATSSDDWDVVVMPLAGNPSTDIVTIAGSSDDEQYVRWAPDSSKVAYVMWSKAGKHVGVTVLWGGHKQLTDSTEEDNYVTWSSDGRYVFFLRGIDLYEIPFDGDPGDEVLVRANFGEDWLDCWSDGDGRYRVLVGPDESDWDGADPPFGTKRPGALLVFSEDGLVSAVTFTTPTTDTLLLTDRTPSYSSDVVVCEARATSLRRVLEENGPGQPKNQWLLDRDGTYPGAALVILRASTGKVASVVALWDQVGGAAVSGPRVSLEGNHLVIHGDALTVYDASGHLVSGPNPVTRAVLDASTGAPIQ